MEYRRIHEGSKMVHLGDNMKSLSLVFGEEQAVQHGATRDLIENVGEDVVAVKNSNVRIEQKLDALLAVQDPLCKAEAKAAAKSLSADHVKVRKLVTKASQVAEAERKGRSKPRTSAAVIANLAQATGEADEQAKTAIVDFVAAYPDRKGLIQTLSRDAKTIGFDLDAFLANQGSSSVNSSAPSVARSSDDGLVAASADGGKRGVVQTRL